MSRQAPLAAVISAPTRKRLVCRFAYARRDLGIVAGRSFVGLRLGCRIGRLLNRPLFGRCGGQGSERGNEGDRNAESK